MLVLKVIKNLNKNIFGGLIGVILFDIKGLLLLIWLIVLILK